MDNYLTSCDSSGVQKTQYSGFELAQLAKALRENSKKSKAAIGRELGVTRASVQDAEDHPERNMTKLRCRIIEACSPFRVEGPLYRLVGK